MTEDTFRDDGGAAFPVCPPLSADGNGSPSQYPFPESGMSLRDWFASQALSSLIAVASDTRNSAWPVTVPEVAEKAYQFADALLAARKKA